jgi:SAM-dependent methyltransferase
MDEAQADRVIEFTCNLCGNSNKRQVRELRREQSSCLACGSTVRTRSVLRALSLELFGANLTVPNFPHLKSLKGIGTSDDPQYASRLAEKFDYRNTFYDRAPRFDITHPQESECGEYDFMISSEVFEHVPPPPESAFANAHRLLKPNGVLVLTVPYSIEDRSLEHFPNLYDYTVTQVGTRSILVNRTREGLLQVFDNLVFHMDSGARPDSGAPLELREFSEHDLTAMLAKAGFAEVRVHGESFERFGIVYPEPWSLPIAARKGKYALSLECAREIMEQWTKLQADLDRMRLVVDSFQRAAWMRLGRALRLIGGGGR